MIGHQKPAGVNPLRAQPSHLRERRKRPPEQVLGRRLRADAVRSGRQRGGLAAPRASGSAYTNQHGGRPAPFPLPPRSRRSPVSRLRIRSSATGLLQGGGTCLHLHGRVPST